MDDTRRVQTSNTSTSSSNLAAMPPLTHGERVDLLDQAQGAFGDLFTAVHIASIARGNRQGTRTLGGLGGDTANAVMLCASTMVQGTLHEVAELYTSPDHASLVLEFAESQRLYELETPSSSAPMRCAALRWSRWQAFSKSVSDRDLVYLEYMDSFVDRASGRRGWARCTKSIVHDSCPERPPWVRAQLFVSGIILRETERPDLLELVTLTHLDVKQNVASWIARAVLRARCKSTFKINHLLKVRRHLRDLRCQGKLTGQATRGHCGDNHSGRLCRGCNEHVSHWKRALKCARCQGITCKSCASLKFQTLDASMVRGSVCPRCHAGISTTTSRGHVEQIKYIDQMPTPQDAYESWIPTQHRGLSSFSPLSSSRSRGGSADWKEREVETPRVPALEEHRTTMMLLDELHMKSLHKPSTRAMGARTGVRTPTASPPRPDWRHPETTSVPTAQPVLCDLSYLQYLMPASKAAVVE